MRTPVTRIRYPIALVFAASLAGATAQAEAQTRDQTRHVHGVAELNLASDDNRVYIELVSPAANLFGFEHAPNNERQRRAMNIAVDILSRGERLFRFPPEAGCQLIEAEIDNPLAEPAGAAGQKDAQQEQQSGGG